MACAQLGFFGTRALVVQSVLGCLFALEPLQKSRVRVARVARHES